MRIKMLNTLREYFATKGKVLSISEYKEQTDTPFRYVVVKRKFGNWGRLENLVGELPEITVPKVVKVPAKKAPEKK